MMNPELIAFLTIALGTVVAYLIGSIPDGVIVGKLYAGIDVRKHGSGNIGTTNTLRLAGWVPGLLVAVLDILKGVLGTLAMMLVLHLSAELFADDLGYLLPEYASGWIHDLAMGLAMLFAPVGHMRSPFLGFKGGKGIATSFGGFIVVIPWVALVTLVVFLAACLLTRYVSVGSLFAAIATLIATYIIYGSHPALVGVSVAIVVLVFYAHRSNIGRLVRGEESRFSVGSKKTAAKARAKERSQAGRERAAADDVTDPGGAASQTEGVGSDDQPEER